MTWSVNQSIERNAVNAKQNGFPPLVATFGLITIFPFCPSNTARGNPHQRRVRISF